MGILAILVALAAAFVALTYPRCHREIRAAKTRLLAGSRILTAQHGDLEYAISGEGSPILLLHGAGGGYDQGLWLGKLALRGGHQLISVSRYGYLRTPIQANASIRTQAALYKDLLDHLRISDVVVIGGSAGGPSAIQFANDYPERTSALILISAVSEADKPSFYVSIIHLIQQSDYAYWLVSKFLRPAILRLMGITGGVQPRLAQEMLDTMHPMSARYRGTVNDGVMIQQQPVATSNVKAPTLILHAQDDALVSHRHALHAHEAIPVSRLVSFPSGGHALLSQMDAVQRELSQFLRKAYCPPGQFITRL